MIRNNKGTILPVAFLLTLLVLAFATANIAKSLIAYRKLQFRNKGYLCTQDTVRLVERYYTVQSRLNRAVQAAYWTKTVIKIPAVYAAAVAAHRALMFAQQVYHLSYLKNVAKSKYCNWKNTGHFAISTPVELVASTFLKRDFDGTLFFRKKWKNYLVFTANGPMTMARDSFAIETEFSLIKGVITHSFTLSSKEINSEALWKLKRLVGL
ncbi:hypothetical protein [Bacteriovorax sp. Seq25_V]|uniref:hypothetical protein n=1 Tax=Bacteriovorax sp. Seq25_V TaxID=1201288 RepID=UPI00038A2862|nr:hypothetical protein [Bacteriovorax sp. Seq25_V]EQC46676.1 hypothetical protein M900_2402 [Bacteriovorax sp. Seq25_V]